MSGAIKHGEARRGISIARLRFEVVVVEHSCASRVHGVVQVNDPHRRLQRCTRVPDLVVDGNVDRILSSEITQTRREAHRP
jgi:hypothetical protein